MQTTRHCSHDQLVSQQTRLSLPPILDLKKKYICFLRRRDQSRSYADILQTAAYAQSREIDRLDDSSRVLTVDEEGRSRGGVRWNSVERRALVPAHVAPRHRLEHQRLSQVVVNCEMRDSNISSEQDTYFSMNEISAWTLTSRPVKNLYNLSNMMNIISERVNDMIAVLESTRL